MAPPLGYISESDRTPEQQKAHEDAVNFLTARRPAFSLPIPTLQAGQAIRLFDLWKDPRVVADVGFVFTRIHQITGSCFPAGTPVRMADGSEKAIETVAVGDKVVTHEGRTRTVKHVMQRPYTGDMVTLHVSGFQFPLEMTADHRVAVLPSRCEWRWQPGDLEWKRADEVEEDDRVIIGWQRDGKAPDTIDAAALLGDKAMCLDDLMGKGAAPVANAGMAQYIVRQSGIDWRGKVKLVRGHSKNAVNRHIPVGPALARLIGLYLAEGGCDKHKVIFTFAADEEPLCGEVLALVKGLFGVGGITYLCNGRKSARKVEFRNHTLVAIFKALVPGNVYSKRVPGLFFSANDETRAALLLGWLHGDGYAALVGKRCREVKITGVTSSEGMARDMTMLALSCGMRACANRRKPRGRSRESFGVHITGPKVVALYPALSATSRAMGAVSRKTDTNVCRYGYARRVKRIDVRPVERLDVFDFEVEEDHSFIAGGLVVHNCVHAGGTNALFSTIAAQRVASTNPTKAFLPFTYHNYALSRHYIGWDTPGEGSLGSTFFKSLDQDGVRAWPNDGSDGLPTYTQEDGIMTSKNVELAWSSVQNPKVMQIAATTKDNTIASVGICRDVKDIRAMVSNGYGVTVACDLYIGNASIRGTGDNAYVKGRWDSRGGHQQCLAPDTKISLLDGTEKTVKDLADSGVPVWIYSYDHSTGKIIPKEATARRTRESVPEGMIRVALDNGESVTTTLDHRFMLRNGEYREAKDLRPGDSLMPLYRKLSTKKDSRRHNGYEMISDPGTGKWTLTHRRVAEYAPLVTLRFNGADLIKGSLPLGTKGVVHHRDFNKLNNMPNNLAWMMNKEHWRYHSTSSTGLWDRWSEEYRQHRRKKARDTMMSLRSDPVFVKVLKKAQTKRLNKLWKDPEFRKRHSEVASKTLIALHADEEFKRNLSDRSREIMKATQARLLADPEYRHKLSARAKAMWADPTYREKHGHHTSETRQKMSVAAKIRNANPAYKKKQLAALRAAAADPMIRKKRSDSAKAYWARKKASAAAAAPPDNHKVESVIFLPSETGPTYCLYVEGTHNFALTAGVFVHNSIHAVWEHPTDGPLYWAQNNWAGDTYPRDPAGGPVCGCWVAEADVAAVFNYHAEVYGLSHLDWFPAQPDLLTYFE